MIVDFNAIDGHKMYADGTGTGIGMEVTETVWDWDTAVGDKDGDSGDGDGLRMRTGTTGWPGMGIVRCSRQLCSYGQQCAGP